ncbi:MAG: hypothetical protein U0528_13065 [Anaerolineae bacterium]
MTQQPLAPNERTAMLDQVFRRISKLEDRALIAIDQAVREAEQGKLPVPAAAAPTTTTPIARPAPTTKPSPFKPPPAPVPPPPIAQPTNTPARTNQALPRVAAVPPSANGESIGRRNFLIGLLTGSVTALCAGGTVGVAFYQPAVQRWLVQRGILPQPSSTTVPSATPLATLPADIVDRLAFLESQVAALTTERDGLKSRVSDLEAALNNSGTEAARLRTELDNANAQIAQLQTDIDSANAQIAQLQTDLERVTTDLETAKTRITQLEGQVGLLAAYQRLEATNLDGTVKNGLEQTSGALSALKSDTEVVKAGRATVANALSTVEADMPTINAGLDWLDREIAVLAASYRAFQTALASAQGSTGAAAIQQFASDQAAALPFTVGQEPRVALQTMGALVAKLPELLDSVDKLTLTPARRWIVADPAQGGLYALLFNPLRNELLTPLDQMVNDAQNVDLIYNTVLTQPTQRVLEQREQIRAEINQSEQQQQTGASN